MTGTCRGRAPASSAHIPRQGFKFKPLLFLNFNFEICDSTLKLEMIGINLPVNLNLNFRSKFNLNLLQVCRLDGSCCPAAAAPPGRGSDCPYRVVSMTRASWVTQRASNLKPAAVLRQQCSAAQTASVDSELSLDLNCPPGKLTKVRVMRLTLAFTRLVLVKINKSPGGIFNEKWKKNSFSF